MEYTPGIHHISLRLDQECPVDISRISAHLQESWVHAHIPEVSLCSLSIAGGRTRGKVVSLLITTNEEYSERILEPQPKGHKEKELKAAGCLTNEMKREIQSKGQPLNTPPNFSVKKRLRF